MEEIIIRNGTADDVDAVMDLVQELALYEKAPHEVTHTAAQMRLDGFGDRPLFNLLVAEHAGVVVGMALCYVRYSTWKGAMTYLEDFYVQEPYRGQGIGHRLFEQCVKQAKADGMAGICWQVLDWNEPALNFYRKYNAMLDPEWINGKILF
jgi:GNAT superfamily N-acetyltransferase